MDSHNGEEVEQPQPRQLPPDLPRSLNDRRQLHNYGGETEMYDGWQGTLETPAVIFSKQTSLANQRLRAVAIPYEP